jgi:two-component system response regulator FixJ
MEPRRTVHLVDDDEAIRRSAGFMLKTAGFAVLAHESGVEFLKEREIEPGCILLDVRMPGMDGLAVMEALKERGLGLPVIVMTGHGDVGLAVRAMKAGAIDFIEKPFEKASLMAALDEGFARVEQSDRRKVRAEEAALRLEGSPRANATCSTAWSRACPTRRSPMISASPPGRSRSIART